MDTATMTKQVAARVTEAMQNSGTTRSGLANAIGTPRTTLNRKLAGHAQFTLLELVAIGRQTATPLEHFLVDLGLNGGN